MGTFLPFRQSDKEPVAVAVAEEFGFADVELGAALVEDAALVEVGEPEEHVPNPD